MCNSLCLWWNKEEINCKQDIKSVGMYWLIDHLPGYLLFNVSVNIDILELTGLVLQSDIDDLNAIYDHVAQLPFK